MFELKHHCPYCRLFPDSNTDHDHFLTCINSRHQKEMRLKTLIIRLETLNTPPPLRTMIINNVKNYYNNDFFLDLVNSNTNLIFDDYTNKQTSIGWEHFIRGRLTSPFNPVINKYYRSNKLGRRFKSSTWYRNMIRFTWQLHHKAWLEYCDTIHAPPKLSTLPSPA